jgi:hypothetical protein
MERKDESKKVILIAIVIVVAVSVASIGYLIERGGSSEPLVVEYKTYTNENYSFKFDYPANWYYQEFSPTTGTAWFGAFDNSQSGASIMLEVYDNNVAENVFGIPLDNVVNYILSFQNRWYENNENYKLIKKPSDIIIGNVHGVSWSATRTSGNTILQFQIGIIVKDNYMYEFVVGSLAGAYSRYERIFENVIDSFSFLD